VAVAAAGAAAGAGVAVFAGAAAGVAVLAGAEAAAGAAAAAAAALAAFFLDVLVVGVVALVVAGGWFGRVRGWRTAPSREQADGELSCEFVLPFKCSAEWNGRIVKKLLPSTMDGEFSGSFARQLLGGLGLVGNDQLADLGVGCGRDNVLGLQLQLIGIGRPSMIFCA